MLLKAAGTQCSLGKSGSSRSMQRMMCTWKLMPAACSNIRAQVGALGRSELEF